MLCTPADRKGYMWGVQWPGSGLMLQVQGSQAPAHSYVEYWTSVLAEFWGQGYARCTGEMVLCRAWVTDAVPLALHGRMP